MTDKLYIGVDVSKGWLDVSDHLGGSVCHLDNTEAAIGFGRPGVRCVLFNVARIAIRWNPILKAFCDRLVTVQHRPGKVALIAVMRKALVILNAIAREGKPWKHAAPT